MHSFFTLSLSSIPASILLLFYYVFHHIRQCSCKKDFRDKTEDVDKRTNQRQSAAAPKKFHMTMGLRSSGETPWLQVDHNYLREHEIKHQLLETRKNEVFGALPSADAASQELLDLIVDFITEHYPSQFELFADGDAVRIAATGEAFFLRGERRSMHPLEIASRLTMEDLSILMKSDEDLHELYVTTLAKSELHAYVEVRVASSTCFPVGWSVEERLGWPLYKIHQDVPLWQEKLRAPVERFLNNISVERRMERNPYFVQVADLRGDLAEILCQTRPLQPTERPTNPEHIIVRAERQTFRRLPRTGAVVFGVKTKMRPLTVLSPDELERIRGDVLSWPDAVARYKGRDWWGDCAIKYCSSVLS